MKSIVELLEEPQVLIFESFRPEGFPQPVLRLPDGVTGAACLKRQGCLLKRVAESLARSGVA